MSWIFRRWRRASVVSAPSEPAAPDGYLYGESDAETSRLNFQHYMFRLAFNGDYSAPILGTGDILDVACGTGRWARDVARRFPSANVVGFDLSRTLLDASLAEGTDTMPENCAFVYGDALQPFAFPERVFSFVMARACSSFIPSAQWPQVVSEMARVTRPGGFVEVRDFGLVRSANAAVNALTVHFANLAQARGIHPGAGPFLKSFLTAARLGDVRVQQVRLRSGVKRGTRAGQLMLADYLAVMERVTPAIAQAGLASAEEWRQLVAQARTETRAFPDEQYAEVELTAAYGRR
ncbi:MAG TPA: class I SAM-dependent methyltransferase [Ktedonobacterales bacterium]|nr:class I SAM-dependent methyltransferase [Ktedonobacterales bacterium]